MNNDNDDANEQDCGGCDSTVDALNVPEVDPTLVEPPVPWVHVVKYLVILDTLIRVSFGHLLLLLKR